MVIAIHSMFWELYINNIHIEPQRSRDVVERMVIEENRFIAYPTTKALLIMNPVDPTENSIPICFAEMAWHFVHQTGTNSL